MKPTKSRILFCVCNYFFLTAVTITCILPMWHQLVISLSDNNYASAGLVAFWPKNFTLDAYAYLLEDSSFFRSLNITVQRLVLGIAINMGLCVLTAYPLSKSNDRLHFRTLYVWYFAVTMFIGGGLIPTYVIVTKTGLINSLWALVVPSGLAVGNMVMMLNFFRGVPTALEESAVLDGAGHIRTLLYVYLPVSTPSLATILLFTMVGHWNDWFSGFIYINRPQNYPLATYLYALVREAESSREQVLSIAESTARQRNISGKTVRTAQLFLAALPIIMAYPFLQRYFIKGIILGSVKE